MIKFRLHKIAADRDIIRIGVMAERAGLNFKTVSGLWNNNVLRIDLSTLEALCEALNCTPGDLLEYIPDTSTKGKKKN
jgi:putative transcriptional regulator